MARPTLPPSDALANAHRRLFDWFSAQQGGVVIAYSGGTDSALMLAVAQKALKKGDLMAVTFDTGTLPAFERQRAADLARSLGVHHRILEIPLFHERAFQENSSDRCHLCKRTLFAQLTQIARSSGLATLVEGTNASDDEADRPGMKAVRESGVQSPLMTLGIDKTTVRALAQREKLSCWNAPARACLATRIPRGVPITKQRVQRVEQLEGALLALGFTDVRAREDESGTKVRLEFFPEELDLATTSSMRALITKAGHQAGYSLISLDLDGLNHDHNKTISPA